MESDSDEYIGSTVENNLPEKKPVKKTPKISSTRRQEAINLKILGKEDPEYRVIEGEKKGSYRVSRRKQPLVQEQVFIPNMDTPKVETPPPKHESENIPVMNYWNTQNTLNTSLSKVLNDLSEKYKQLETKYVKAKQTLKKSKKQSSDDEPTEEEIRAYEQYLKEQEQKQQPSHQNQIPRRRIIDINSF
jgi:hypothetical protein